MNVESVAKMQLPGFLRSRILRQSTALTRKNFLIFYKTPIATIVRALLFPIAVTLVLCLLKHILGSSNAGSSYTPGIASSAEPLKDLASALDTAPGHKLVFVRNGVKDLEYVINGVVGSIGERKHLVVDDPEDLFHLCQPDLSGASDCFAAIIFTASNDTNVDYIM